MYWSPWRWTIDGWLGAGLAVALAGATAVVSFWLEAPFVAFIATVGAVVGAIVGGRAGAAVVTSDHPLRLAVRAAAQATLIVMAFLAIVALLAPFGRSPDNTANPLVEILLGLVIGPLYVLIFGLPAAIAVAIPAVAIRRAFGGRRRPLATVLGAGLIVIAVAGGGLAADWSRRDARRAAGLPDLQAAGWFTLDRAAVRLEYVVVNHSREGYAVAIRETTGPGESSGSIGGIGPCKVGASRMPLGPDWSVHVGPDTTNEMEREFGVFDLPAIASSADTPGRDPRIRIEIAPDGSTTVTRDQPFPSDADLLASAC